jgi:cephalosporin-C deacetylase
MPSIDLALDQLRSYTPAETEPPDFDQFWAKTLEEAKSDAASSGTGFEVGEPYMPLAGVLANKVWMTSLGNARLSGWYVRPRTGGPFPGIVHFHGYSGRGARPLEVYPLAAQGIAVLSMDCRGQAGDSPDIGAVDAGHHAGWLTRGLADPASHYYRYVFADAALAVDALCSRQELDADRVAVMGMSQGGGLAVAAAALSGRPCFVWSDMPFLSDFPRAVEITPNPPYTEISTHLKRRPELTETAFRTLGYIDVANHARRVSCPARMSVGLWDQTCPPSTVFAAYGRLASQDKDLVVLPYHGHEVTYELEELRFSELLRRLGASPAR